MLLLSSYNYPLARGCSLEMLSVGDETGASQIINPKENPTFHRKQTVIIGITCLGCE